MMRPMKLAGEQLMFGSGCLDHLKTLSIKKAVVVLGGSFFHKSRFMKRVKSLIEEAGGETAVFVGVEPDPGLKTVLRGAEFMLQESPDWIIALGGGSVMDAAKAMWVYYEHPHLNTLEPLMDKENFPKLRKKAKFICIPTTAGTASEVSRSIVITDDETGIKHGIGNMEMMPDVALCDPDLTLSMPPHLTAETGMDALVHAVEAMVSRRANYLSNTLAQKAVIDIFQSLPIVVTNGNDLAAREVMLNASMIAGLAFTNVSLGIVHSMSHSVASVFKTAHGLTNSILMPYVVEFNQADHQAKVVYQQLASELGVEDFASALRKLNRQIGIPTKLEDIITDKDAFIEALDKVVELSIADGCTKTNPIIPTHEQFKIILMKAYQGI